MAPHLEEMGRWSLVHLVSLDCKHGCGFADGDPTVIQHGRAALVRSISRRSLKPLASAPSMAANSCAPLAMLIVDRFVQTGPNRRLDGKTEPRTRVDDGEADMLMAQRL